MRRLRKFLRLPATKRRLLLEAALLLGGTKLGLRLFPFQTLLRFLEKLAKASAGLPEIDQSSAKRIVWAVELAGQYLPWVRTCLTQALAAQFLLVRQGHPALVHIGVVREEGEGFLAHAWVESEGEVVIGGRGHELDRYVPLIALQGESS